MKIAVNVHGVATFLFFLDYSWATMEMSIVNDTKDQREGVLESERGVEGEEEGTTDVDGFIRATRGTGRGARRHENGRQRRRGRGRKGRMKMWDAGVITGTLVNLEPNTRYAVFVKTVSLDSSTRGAQSEVMYATTSPYSKCCIFVAVEEAIAVIVVCCRVSSRMPHPSDFINGNAHSIYGNGFCGVVLLYYNYQQPPLKNSFTLSSLT